MRCLNSSCYAWIRRPRQDDEENKSDSFVELGDELFISGLIPSTNKRLSYPLFYLGKSYSIRKSHYPKHSQVLEEYYRFQDHEVIRQLSSTEFYLRDLFHQEQTAVISSLECSLKCTVISWRIISSSSKFTTVEIHGTDQSYISVLIEHTIPSDILNKVSKAYEKGSDVQVEFGIITSLDPTFDAIRVTSGDRTVISRGRKSKASVESLETEELRMASLRYNRMEFALNDMNISCTRFHLNSAEVIALRRCIDGRMLIVKIASEGNISIKMLPHDVLEYQVHEWRDKAYNSAVDEWISINESYDLTFSTTFQFIDKYQIDGIIFSLRRKGICDKKVVEEKIG